ncbi:MAG: hypothetical protein KF749_12680 [Bacteroidetes bacterium]|nr:hypothetical protein [Bacteroidota bacterium]MCW5897124.1 hypothetical protein [Bacteroidota bacterium]
MNAFELVKAIELALADNWEEAHRIVQNYDDEFACWIHAVLHKIEGDEGNSRYWYRRAGREFSHFDSTNSELERIKTILTKQT